MVGISAAALGYCWSLTPLSTSSVFYQWQLMYFGYSISAGALRYYSHR